jgi:7-carboxy-7-deazaguanine synthase
MSITELVERVADSTAAVTGRVKLTEIFLSIQGEADSVGWPTVFVRLTGCPLRCNYCDTEYAFYGGQWHAIAGVLQQVAAQGVQRVCVTGGEPLAQKGCIPLLKALCDAGYNVSLETSGALDIAPVDTRVSRVVDLKTPGSGEERRNRYENIALLTPHDQLKFVLCDRVDYEWAAAVVRQYKLHERCMVLFSSSYAQLPTVQLAEWVLADRLAVRVQVQLHKILWGEMPGK